jgi:hypothetical protein
MDSNPAVRRRASLALILLAFGLLSANPGFAATDAALGVRGSAFVITTADGEVLTSRDLVGATLNVVVADGSHVTLRLDAVTPDERSGGVLLHAFSLRDARRKRWTPFCEPDSEGRSAGFPIAGAWSADGRFIRDPKRWFVTCTSGAEGKCLLRGYDPWARGPGGEDLAPYYEACQHAIRADYDGRGDPHTRKGTIILMTDTARIATDESAAEPAYVFEAGWGPAGAVCVAHTRWPDLLSMEALLKSAPRLEGHPCDEAEARRRGALVFTRSMIRP